jgi:L,D-peptidoglycan transpeptidase YkuD (ErfK/YbiS/YcfS/YnhG family)
MGWCDDSKSKYYNKQIKIPSKDSHEILYRKDNIYDIVCVINYNINPTLKKKGSAIFLHVARNKYQKTRGCIALKKKHLRKLLPLINKNTKIKIG